MRQDMYKVICERPRNGGSYWNDLPNSYRKAKRFTLTEDLDCVDYYSGHTKLPMRARDLGWDPKSFNDYLSPLYRFIEAQVGRKWDDVYSEICRNISLTSTTRRHVRQHVDNHVELNCYYDEDGELCYNGRWGFRQLYKGDLYRDPKDGILKMIPKSARTRYGRYDPNFKAKQQGILREHGDLIFRKETTGVGRFETVSWFKYHWIVVDRVRTILEVGDDGKRVYRHESYKDRINVRDTASKKEIRDYGLNG